MSDTFKPSGLFVPLVTPFDDRDRVDIDALEHLAHEALNAGASGIVALGTTGESTSLDTDERDATVGACARVCADHEAALIVGAGTNDTRTTIARHEALSDVKGVRASLAVVPYYVRPSEAAIVRHFQKVASQSPVPLIVYNIPHRTGQGLGPKSLLELAATDGVAGVKQVVGGIDADTLTLLSKVPSSFAVLGGDDPFLFPLVLMGGAGAIAACSNLCTGRFAQMIADGLDGRLTQGREHAEALLPLAQALFAEPNPAVIKAVLHAEGKIPTPHVRMPMSDASSGALQEALDALRAAQA